MFNQAAVAVADKDFKTAIKLLEDVCQFGVEEVKALLGSLHWMPWDNIDENESAHDKSERLDKNESFFSDLRVLEADCRRNKQLAEALQKMFNGDKDLKLALANHENFQVDLIFQVEDLYKYALLLAKGEDVEIVCMANTKLAKLYLKVYTDGIHRTGVNEKPL